MRGNSPPNGELTRQTGEHDVLISFEGRISPKSRAFRINFAPSAPMGYWVVRAVTGAAEALALKPTQPAIRRRSQARRRTPAMITLRVWARGVVKISQEGELALNGNRSGDVHSERQKSF